MPPSATSSAPGPGHPRCPSPAPGPGPGPQGAVCSLGAQAQPVYGRGPTPLSPQQRKGISLTVMQSQRGVRGKRGPHPRSVGVVFVGTGWKLRRRSPSPGPAGRRPREEVRERRVRISQPCARPPRRPPGASCGTRGENPQEGEAHWRLPRTRGTSRWFRRRGTQLPSVPLALPVCLSVYASILTGPSTQGSLCDC